MTPPPASEEVESLPVLAGSPGTPNSERFWSLVRESLAGSRRDLTVMPLGRAILLLAVPMVLEMVMESVFAVADIFWVSKLGADAVATVGLTESLLTIVYAVSMGLAMGVGAVVARRTGAKDAGGAGRAAVQGVLLGFGLAVVFGGVGGLFAPRLLALLGASPGVLATGTGFARLMLGGCVTIVLLFMINAAFRGAGDASITLRTLWLANGINILLGPVLVFGLCPAPRLGVNGAALATNIGRGIGVLYQFWMLGRGSGRLVIRRQHLTLDGETLLRRNSRQARRPGSWLMSMPRAKSESWSSCHPSGPFQTAMSWQRSAWKGNSIPVRASGHGPAAATSCAPAGPPPPTRKRQFAICAR